MLDNIAMNYIAAHSAGKSVRKIGKNQISAKTNIFSKKNQKIEPNRFWSRPFLKQDKSIVKQIKSKLKSF